jgi:hypothetical protein
MDAGDPIYGAYFPVLPGIGYFQTRARQLTSQAFGRAMDRELNRCLAGGFFIAPCPQRRSYVEQ